MRDLYFPYNFAHPMKGVGVQYGATSTAVYLGMFINSAVASKDPGILFYPLNDRGLKFSQAC